MANEPRTSLMDLPFTEMQMAAHPQESNQAGGGLTNYYLVMVSHPQRTEQPPYQAECEDIIEALELNFDEGNIFKEIWRSANARKGNGKPGNTEKRGAEKILHYARRIHRRITR